MSNKQILDYIETDMRDFAKRGIAPLTCVQTAGDVVIIPENWGHGERMDAVLFEIILNDRNFALDRQESSTFKSLLLLHLKPGQVHGGSDQ